ncbi:Hypothetical protein R9X50_00008200 [Acrodontium crateriforme]|uniref:Uncharacterized protein n=1 Tax=Acrodontium crateriforme TaxID=150365 RepID=A0AAQ3LWM0_9PEZI|nr:Hypothetical protein R9X50_00008200 [Acrodontium crateriforme]
MTSSNVMIIRPEGMVGMLGIRGMGPCGNGMNGGSMGMPMMPQTLDPTAGFGMHSSTIHPLMIPLPRTSRRGSHHQKGNFASSRMGRCCSFDDTYLPRRHHFGPFRNTARFGSLDDIDWPVRRYMRRRMRPYYDYIDNENDRYYDSDDDDESIDGDERMPDLFTSFWRQRCRDKGVYGGFSRWSRYLDEYWD